MSLLMLNILVVVAAFAAVPALGYAAYYIGRGVAAVIIWVFRM